MSYKIYDVTQTVLCYDGYRVRINGNEVKCDTARVSAYPFNRRWPGHQRSLEQTELVNFVSLQTDEALSFEIKPPQKSEKVVIRPLSLGINPQIKSDGTITFTLPKAAYFTVEPYGRSNALHIFADPVSKYDINADDENVVYFGKGEHDAGIIELGSNQTLFIDEGAVVYACVRAKEASNIKILGRGILDNSRNKEEILFEANEQNNTRAVLNARRLHTVQLEFCENIEIEGITIRDSLVYNIRPIVCKNLSISNVKLIGNWRYNSDGIDMHNCVNVDIDNCFIRTFDDCLCIKGFDSTCMHSGDKGQFTQAKITNCVLWNDWGRCLEIGAETRTVEICDILFENCHIIHVTMPALDCQNADYAYIHDVIYRNIDVEYDDIIPECVLQTSDDMCYEAYDTDYAPSLIGIKVIYHHEYSANGERRGINKNITFENIRLYGRHKPKIEIESYNEEFASTGILIKNLYHNGNVVSGEQCDIKTDNYSEFRIVNDIGKENF